MAENNPYPSTDPLAGGIGGATPSGVRDRFSDATTQARGKVSEVTSQAREKASELGRSTVATLDRNLDTAAGALSSTAETIREKAGAGSDRVSKLAGSAADKLDTTAQYFREHHTRDMMSGVDQLIRRNPGATLAAALAVGFLLGSALKRDRRYS